MTDQATHLKIYRHSWQNKSESDRPNDRIMAEKELDKKMCVYEAGVITELFNEFIHLVSNL